ncbi:hypothetical protein BGX27_007429 [Mortierella sp. AM989]|nr:hypothetical protein BGX27_007429 [Mortierella sp. AM989]
MTRNATEVDHVVATSAAITDLTPSSTITPEPISPHTPEYNLDTVASTITKNDALAQASQSSISTTSNNEKNDLSRVDDAKSTTVDSDRTAAAATTQTITNISQSPSSDDIKTLTKVLTTPFRALETDGQPGSHCKHSNETMEDMEERSESSKSIGDIPTVNLVAFDGDSLCSQAVLQTSLDQKRIKRASNNEYDQRQAARALQLIALSLNSSATSQSTEPPRFDTNKQLADRIKLEVTEGDPASASLGRDLGDPVNTRINTSLDASEALAAISRAINLPSRSSDSTELGADSSAFAQAILSATQCDTNKIGTSHNTVDQEDIHKDHVDASSTLDKTAGTVNLTTTSISSSSQGFTFEFDKNTGKTQIKWTTDPNDVSSALQETNAIQQALQALIAHSGIPELSDLSAVSGGLLAPPLGQFPAQGSEFGITSEPEAPVASPYKKRKMGGSSKQNTAASIPEGSTSYPCTFPGCEKVFARLYNLKSHSRTHTDERPFECSHCQLAFSRNHDLKRHVKIHGGGKLFTCHGCGKSFSRLDALGRHKNNSKNRTGCQSGPEEAIPPE